MENLMLKRYIQVNDHKKIMLSGLLAATSVLFLIFGIWAYMAGVMSVFMMKLFLFVATVILFFKQLSSERTLWYASLFLILIEIEGFSGILGAAYYNFIVIYPFFPVFGFFFFYRLRTASILTLLHVLAWLAFAAAVYGVDSGNPAYAYLPLASMLASTLVVIFVGVIYHISTEITYQKLKDANTQKLLLLKEIHHRIKNNLNKMSSSLGLQILRIRQGHCEGAEEILVKNKLRIEAMSLVHEALYHSEDIGQVDVKIYIQKLLALIGAVYARKIRFSVETGVCVLPLEKVLRLGSILNELYTNSIKYSIEEDPALHIRIRLHVAEGVCHFLYEQRGVHGIKKRDQLTQGKGLGMMLVALSAKEMGGALKTALEENLLRFEIVFPL